MVSIGRTLIVALCFVLSAASENIYYVGGWQPADADAVTKLLAPLFQDYLTQAVGTKLDPPAKFVFKPIDLDITTSSRSMILSDQLHFAYLPNGAVACKAAEFSWVPIATQRNLFGTAVTGGDAMVIFSRLNNTAITKIEDLKGAKAGFGFLLSGATYLIGYQMFLDHGIHSYRDLNQVRFYGTNYEAYYKGVMSGELDVGLATSSWLVNNHGKEMSQLRILELGVNLSFEGDLYPAPATKLVPGYGFAASDKLSYTLKLKVLDALLAINASHPAYKNMKIAGFGCATSYDALLTAVENAGVLYEENGKRMCRDPYSRQDIWTAVSCPKGYDKVDYNTSAAQCDQAGMPCPAGVVCFCRPCVKRAQNVFRWETVVALCAALYGVGAFYLLLKPLGSRPERVAYSRWGDLDGGEDDPLADRVGKVRRASGGPPRTKAVK